MKFNGNHTRTAIIVILLFSFSCAKGQTDTLVFYPVNNPLLQQSDIRHITITNDGKLWLSTSQGIISYDGNDANVFNEYNIFKSFDNQENDLFLIEMNGIHYFDKKTGTSKYLDIAVPPEYASPDPRTYTDIYADKDGSVWCAHSKGFLRFDTASQKTSFFTLPAPPDKNGVAVICIQGDKKNTDLLWLGTEDGIFMFNKKNIAV